MQLPLLNDLLEVVGVFDDNGLALTDGPGFFSDFGVAGLFAK